jgi:hypothetical protein
MEGSRMSKVLPMVRPEGGALNNVVFFPSGRQRRPPRVRRVIFLRPSRRDLEMFELVATFTDGTCPLIIAAFDEEDVAVATGVEFASRMRGGQFFVNNPFTRGAAHERP